MSDSKLRPGMLLGRYPQQKESDSDKLEALAKRYIDSAKYLINRRRNKLQYIVDKVNRHEDKIKNLSEEALTKHIFQLRQKLQRRGLKEELIVLSFATVREVARRVLGKRHFDVQIFGGWVMIKGMIAEMETGEGKTLTSTLPACTAALAGIPVHIITSNDYLASRDAEILQPLYERMGLSVASVVDGMETDERMAAYANNIVHTTNQQITFDYLRDRIEMGDNIGQLRMQFRQIQSEQLGSMTPFLLRGLCFAIIDEADSVLIDEARTPLIISKPRPNELQDQTYFDAIYLASSLQKNIHFLIKTQDKEITLTDKGKQHLETLIKTLDEIWTSRRWREIMVKQALTAKYLFERDKHYMVRDQKIQIVDQQTGRAMPDRSWEHGLHQLIEAKEECEITQEKDPLARISYQRFFSRYLRVAGMSGTVTEVARELGTVYQLRVVQIPPHKPSRRQMLPERIYKTSEQKWTAFLNKIRILHEQGQPILIGTCSVSDSEKISDRLKKEKLPHRVLNASQDHNEADIIAKAGQLKSITVATNMAGRGTDIGLGEGVEELGGLHVIATARNEARRIDRQLYGRCARQGDPGSAEAFISLQDEDMELFYSTAMLKLLSGFCRNDKPLPDWLGKIILAVPQKWVEYQHYRTRLQLLKQDKQQARSLAFTGRME